MFGARVVVGGLPVLVAAAMFGSPGVAAAATVSVTGDSGEPVALSPGAPAQIRNMSPSYALAFAASEKRYSLDVVSPGGQAQPGAIACATVDQAAGADSHIAYQGNGTYTIHLSTDSDDTDTFCDHMDPVQTYTFTIAASVTLTPPKAPLLLHEFHGSGDNELPFSISLNPGATSYGVKYSSNPLLPNGTIEDARDQPADPKTGVAAIDFQGVGTYTLLAQAYSGDGASPFSAPVVVAVVAPFEFSDPPFLVDSTGPTYKVKGQERDGSGVDGARMIVSIAKGKGKFKRIASPKFDSNGAFSFHFKQRHHGHYRFRYQFKGTKYVLPGTYTRSASLK